MFYPIYSSILCMLFKLANANYQASASLHLHLEIKKPQAAELQAWGVRGNELI
jgi:hypothetical protein